jgi:MerR family transcriptional regulator, thiopeptide resistance regulator
MTLRHPLYYPTERRNTLDSHFYHTSEFAQKAAVSVRTLRYYDNVGLLSPTSYTEAGYRLYTETDLSRLQQILALKFLGFSLEEIRQCLQIGPTVLQESLALQKAMMQEKRVQLDAIIKAIDETEVLLQANHQDWDSIVRVIQVIQMTQSNDWRKKYFTDEQLQQAEALNKQYYTDEQRQKLAEWGKDFSEEDQRVATQRWNTVIAELQRLVAVDTDPVGAEAQALMQQWNALLQEFTHGDAGITKSLGNMYKGISQMPAGQAPYAMPFNQEEGKFLEKAMKAYNESQS